MSVPDANSATPPDRVSLDVSRPIWDHFYHVAPLVVIGSRDEDGGWDLAPKHMAAPMGWSNYFGFVCTSAHATYDNVVREGAFTVSFLRHTQVVDASLAAAPRYDGGEKPSLKALATVPATEVDGVLLADAYLHLECRTHRIVDGFGSNTLVTGEIVAAHVAADAVRRVDEDDAEILVRSPILAFVAPDRYAEIAETRAFPFHVGWSR